jgi:uncharacterized repeat protein (TIGR01451 family)
MFKRIRNLIRRKPKTFIGLSLAVIAAAVIVPLAVSAGYGPNRPTYDWNKYDPSVSCTNSANDYGRCGSMTGPVFDSFINTPSYGDEENFNTIANVVPGQSPTDASYGETATAVPGQEYWVRTLVHNDANQNLNCLPIHDDKATDDCTQIDPGSPSIATGTKVRLAIADGVANGVDVETYISASNSTPAEVWDTSTLQNSNQAFDVSYVPGSAMIYNSAFPNGLALPDSIDSTSGTQIGYNAMNGILPGCFNYSAYVYVKVQVKAPALTVQKDVRPVGSTSDSSWVKTMPANAGDTVQWRIAYQDTGSADDDNLTIHDTLPAGLSIVPGSIKLYDEYNDGTVQSNTALSGGGVNLGNYAPSANDINGEIEFDTTIAKTPPTCTITNVGYGSAENVPPVSSSASVTINNCKTPPTPSYACTALGVSVNGKTVTINKFDQTSSGGATFTDAVINWGDNSQSYTTNEVIGASHTYSGYGTFNITAVANFSVNGQNETPATNGCVAQVSFTPPTPGTTTTTTTSSSSAASAQLVNTGPDTAQMVGIFLVVTALGSGLYHRLLRRNLANK